MQSTAPNTCNIPRLCAKNHLQMQRILCECGTWFASCVWSSDWTWERRGSMKDDEWAWLSVCCSDWWLQYGWCFGAHHVLWTHIEMLCLASLCVCYWLSLRQWHYKLLLKYMLLSPPPPPPPPPDKWLKFPKSIQSTHTIEHALLASLLCVLFGQPSVFNSQVLPLWVCLLHSRVSFKHYQALVGSWGCQQLQVGGRAPWDGSTERITS